MRIGVLRTAALVAVSLVGVAAGLAAAELRDEPGDPGTTTSTGPSDPPSDIRPVRDPLDLGAPLENLDCTKDTILVIDRGEDRAALRTAIVDFPDAKYLKTADSCRTMYARVGEPTPGWVAYLGPFDIQEGCRLRMEPVHRGHYMTRLQRGNEDLVKCLCELNVVDDDFPVLTPGMVPTEREMAFINQLQGSLLDLGRLPPESEWPNWTYDQATIDQVNQMVDAFSPREPDGITDAPVWDIVRDRVCPHYAY